MNKSNLSNLSNLFTRAHEIARTLEGDYVARISYSLRCVWSEVKLGSMLEGSEKQIKWANEIRKSILKKLVDLKDCKNKRYTESIYNINNLNTVDVENAIKVVKSIKDAKYFIDNRNKDYKDFILENRVIKITAEMIEEARNNERIMKRVSNHAEKDENYSERTYSLVIRSMDLDYQTAKELVSSL